MKRMRLSTLGAVICTVVLMALASAAFMTLSTDDQGKKYERTEVMIPVRDGIKLKTYIFKPKEITESLPFLMMRTPYGAEGYGVALATKAFAHFANEGFYDGETQAPSFFFVFLISFWLLSVS